MSKKAIAVPYAVYQNEPSVPYKKIVTVPDDRSTHRELFIEILSQFYYSESGEYERFEINYTPSRFGDVSFGNGDMFVFFTFID